MIKAVGEVAGKPLLILGLSIENLRRLIEHNEPIVLETEPLGLAPMRVVIFAGGTEAQMLAEMQKTFRIGKVHGEFSNGGAHDYD